MAGESSQKAAKPVIRFAMAGSLNRNRAELMRRDPLGREYLEMEGGRRKYDGRRLDELRDTLDQKYGTDPRILFWDWAQIERERAAGRAPLADWVIPGYGAIDFKWSGAGMPFEINHEDGGKTFCPGLRKGGKGPRIVTFEIRLDRINQWDLDYIAKWVKTRLREVLKAVSMASKHERVESPELAFLNHARPEDFERDLRRYDLHMTHGLSFRLIALLESQQKGGRTVAKVPRQQLVRHKVAGESSLADSVGRIYKAIHRESWKARRRRLDRPEVGAEEFSCPDHPGNRCDKDCRHLRDWWKKIQPTLPSDRTGILR